MECPMQSSRFCQQLSTQEYALSCASFSSDFFVSSSTIWLFCVSEVPIWIPVRAALGIASSVYSHIGTGSLFLWLKKPISVVSVLLSQSLASGSPHAFQRRPNVAGTPNTGINAGRSALTLNTNSSAALNAAFSSALTKWFVGPPGPSRFCHEHRNQQWIFGIWIGNRRTGMPAEGPCRRTACAHRNSLSLLAKLCCRKTKQSRSMLSIFRRPLRHRDILLSLLVRSWEDTSLLDIFKKTTIFFTFLPRWMLGMRPFNSFIQCAQPLAVGQMSTVWKC